jgi:DNA-binding PadR family transcriptional regulator
VRAARRAPLSWRTRPPAILMAITPMVAAGALISSPSPGQDHDAIMLLDADGAGRAVPATTLHWGMHKTLHLLGLLLGGPKTGYDLHRILRAHGELYADLKKANVYYLLDRLARDGCLTVEVEPGARGPRRERLVYSITDRGRARFDELLQEVLRTPEPSFSSVAAAIIFLDRLPQEAAVSLLEERRRATRERRRQVVSHGEQPGGGPMSAVAVDHLLSLIDADLAWTDRTLETIQADR